MLGFPSLVQPRRVRSLVSADGAAWRVKPEIRTLAQIIAERQADGSVRLRGTTIAAGIRSWMRRQLFTINPFGGNHD